MRKFLFAALVTSMLIPGCIPGTGTIYNPYRPQQAGTYSPAPAGSISPAPAHRTASYSAGLPQSYSEFRERCMDSCRTPEGAIKMYFDAVFCYIRNPRNREAANMMRFILHEGKNWEHSPNLVTFNERLKDPSCHHIFRSFAYGTSPENDYAMDPANYQVMIDGIRYEGADVAKATLISSGADNPRLITLRQYEDGLWYMFANAGTYAQVRSPASSRISHSHDAAYDSYR